MAEYSATPRRVAAALVWAQLAPSWVTQTSVTAPEAVVPPITHKALPQAAARWEARAEKTGPTGATGVQADPSAELQTSLKKAVPAEFSPPMTQSRLLNTVRERFRRAAKAAEETARLQLIPSGEDQTSLVTADEEVAPPATHSLPLKTAVPKSFLGANPAFTACSTKFEPS